MFWHVFELPHLMPAPRWTGRGRRWIQWSDGPPHHSHYSLGAVICRQVRKVRVGNSGHGGRHVPGLSRIFSDIRVEPGSGRNHDVEHPFFGWVGYQRHPPGTERTGTLSGWNDGGRDEGALKSFAIIAADAEDSARTLGIERCGHRGGGISDSNHSVGNVVTTEAGLRPIRRIKRIDHSPTDTVIVRHAHNGLPVLRVSRHAFAVYVDLSS